MNTFHKVLLGITVGILLGASGAWLLSDSGKQETAGSDNSPQPLYWVAPMDPNYKRDQPGKSPMGMDLVPVYEDGDDEAGIVKISPAVVNNLGVRSATVKTGHLQPLVKTVGYVQYDENRLVHISPRVEGWIEELFVKAAGDPVTQGEPLFALYSPTLVNAQEELLLSLKRNNPALIDAAIERLSALQVSQTDIDRLRKTRKVSQTLTVTAPQSGVLDNLSVREGMFVKPGMSMMSIGQLEHIWVIGEVFERQVGLVGEGDKVRLRLDYLPAREWTGQVDYIYPSLNTDTRTVQVRVHLDNPDQFLKPGMFAQMEIETQPREEALLIPREALIRSGAQSRVVVALGDGKFKSVAVEVGHIAQHQVEILAGLNSNERIVTSAQFLIDSESSKTSDFKRMDGYTQQNGATEEQTSAEAESVWVSARVDSLMPDHRKVTLQHDAIPEWQWPAMTMDFTAQDGIALDSLQPGMRLHVQITRTSSGDYLLTRIHIPEQEKTEDPDSDGEDHSQHRGKAYDATVKSQPQTKSNSKEHHHD
ncbi:efflux RND transporter periplasmic adaptor subunit [Lacimicrobium alkaliphilum]|uniref:Hemolysin D n=1 Tax=Lacimicrobium alkaliphilum TaxID=1526571 RepID=A0A0U2ZK93_9ALTE|nr:efflux RND transporter periplasmic adaptor subunit [Lacimicrobium alkaliphilum]ALS99431.1 hemolysin D [Lacimicrobium alkaliphilum]